MTWLRNVVSLLVLGVSLALLAAPAFAQGGAQAPLAISSPDLPEHDLNSQ